MNRRRFLATSTAAAALAATTTAPAQQGTKRLKVLIPPQSPEHLADLKAAATDVELVECRDAREALAHAADADASYGYITPEILRAGKQLKWVQQPSAGVEHLMEIPELVQGDV